MLAPSVGRIKQFQYLPVIPVITEMTEGPKSINERFKESILDLEKVIEKAQLIRKIEERAEDSYEADEAEISMIQEDITDYRAQIRRLSEENP